MHSTIAKSIYLVGTKYRNPSLWNEYERLKESEWLSRDQLNELQLERTKSFLTFVEKYSPYYKRIFKQYGFSATRFDSIDNIKTIPIMTKEQLIENSAAIHSIYDFPRIFLAETSGTTGSALEFMKNERWDSINRANMMRAYDWYEVKLWERNGYFWGYNIEPQQATKVKILDYIQNRFRIFDYKKESIKLFAEKLSTARYISGYSSMIYEVAKVINQLDIERPALKLVKGTSEMILDIYQQESIQAFGRKIVSEYGAAESGLIAFECPNGNMHINVEDVLIEVDDNSEIIVTNLASYSYPVIRYRLGDVVELSDAKCNCGREHPIIQNIIGRKGATVHGRSGAYPALTFYYVFKNLAINQSVFLNYKAVQKEKGIVDIYIENSSNRAHETILTDELIKYFINDISFNITYVNGFDSERKKSQYFESKL